MKMVKKGLFLLALGLVLFVITSCFSRSITLDFNSNGGTPVTQVVLDKGTIPDEPAAPSKTGFDFNGWFTDQDLSQAYGFDTPLERNTTLYARWQAKIYQVTWDTQGGSVIADSSVPYQGLVSQPTPPTKRGYVFRGWFTSATYTTAYQFSTLMPSQNITLFAKWEPGEFVVSFETYGGSLIGDVIGFYQDNFEAPTLPNRYGYSFEGWYLDEDLTLPFTDFIIPNQHVTLHAKWEPVSIPVTFMIVEGNVVNDSVLFNQAIAPIATPIRDGYTFQGWNKEGTPYVFTNPVISISPVVLTAAWSPNNYTIDFEENGGTEVASITAPYLSVVSSPPIPSKVGHSFDGWFTDSEFITSYQFTTMPLGGKVLYARWSVNNYSLQFNTGGGNTLPTLTQPYGSAIDLIDPPTKAGYEFAGWYLESNYQQTYIIPATMPAQSRTIFAKWDLVTYSITYDLQDGTATNPTSYTIESDAIILQAPSKLGYQFGGWLMEGSSEPQFVISIPAGSTGARHYEATFNPITYTITYQLSGGSVSNPTSYTVETDTITLLAPQRDGYVFLGWTFSGQVTPVLDVTITKGSTGNRHFVAVYELESYDITYYLDEGNNHLSNPATYTIVSNTITIADPSKVGHTFQGWFDNASFSGAAITSIETGSYGDVTLYAKFTINAYTIYYYVDGHFAISELYPYNAVVVPANDQTRTGYTFSGWSAIPGNMPAEDVRVDGTFTLNTYAIEYVLYGGDNDDDNPTTYTIVSNTITIADPSKVGHTFQGWFDNASFSGTAITSIETGSYGDVTLYAKFTINAYTIYYYVDGHFAISELYPYNAVVVPANDRTRTGYTFSGWSAIPGNMPAEDVRVDGTFTPISYTITYHLNGGNNHQENPATYTIESGVITLNNPNKTGYSFEGWYDNVEFTGLSVSTIPAASTGSQTFYAKWNLVTYDITYDLDGGDNHQDNPTTYTIESNTIVLLDAEKEGYQFLRWENEQGQVVTSIVKGSNGPLTLTAIYGVNEYTIRYYVDGDLYQTISYDFDTVVISLIEPTQTGYTFSGWSSIPSNMPAEDVRIDGTFTPIDYTIIYELDGGENHQDNPDDYTIESSLITLENPSKTGYTFLGWFDNASFSGAAITSIAAGSYGNLALFAKFLVNTYDLQYYVDGVLHQTVTYAYQAEVTPLTEPTQTGYTFSGWSSIPSNMPAQDVRVDGTFTINTYVIEYYVDDVLHETMSYEYNAAVTSLPELSQTGYAFSGWSSIPSNMPAQDVRVDGTFTLISYTLTYDLDGGDNHQDNPATYTIESEVVTLENPTKAGYSFGGWFDNAAFTGLSISSIPAGSTGHQTFYAKWNLITYDITYDLGGGDNHQDNPATYTIESSLITLGNPSKTGYTFLGWFDNEAFSGTAITNIVAGSYGNMTLYAKFSINSYQVNYYVDGVFSDSETYPYGSLITLISEPTQTGYTFSGWSSIPSNMPAQDVRVDGTFAPTTYTITYDVDNGNNHANNPTTYTIESNVITLQNPTKTGYSFGGWYDNPAFSGSSIGVITAGSTGDRNFYAKWNLVSYTITYDLDGGDNHQDNPTSYTIESSLITLDFPSKTGYTFDGWYLTSDFSQSISVIQEGTHGSITLYAKWSLISYTITYMLDGGNEVGSNPASYTIESGIMNFNPTSKTGYTFHGWYDNEAFNGTPISSLSAGSFGHLVLYAKFQVNYYDVIFYSDAGEIIGTIQQVTYGTQINLSQALVGKPLEVAKLIELNTYFEYLSQGAISQAVFSGYLAENAALLATYSPDMAAAIGAVISANESTMATAIGMLMYQAATELAVRAQALDVKISLLDKLKEDMAALTLLMLDPEAQSDPDKAQALAEASQTFFIYLHASQGAYATYTPSMSSLITTWLASMGNDFEAFMNLYSIVTFELDEAQRVKLSLLGGYPIKQGYSFIGWELGSETRYLGFDEYIFPGIMAYVPASTGLDPAKLRAKYVRITDIIGSFNDVSNIFSWTALSPTTLAELYDSSLETISVEYEIYIRGLDNEISLYMVTSGTQVSLSYLGQYSVIVVPVIDVFRNGVLVNTITADVATSSGRLIEVIRAEGNASVEASGNYYHRLDSGNYHFFSNTEITFTNANFTILSGSEYVSVDPNNTARLIFGSQYSTAVQTISFTFTANPGGTVYTGYIYPYISQFDLGESLTSYLQMTSNIEDSLYIDKTVQPYLVGRSYVSEPTSSYYTFNQGNGFYLPLLIKTTGGVSINVPSYMLEYRVFKGEDEVTISTTNAAAEVYRQANYLYFSQPGETYTIYAKLGQAYVPAALSSIITEKSFTVSINQGANVYTNAQLKVAYGDVAIQSINLHNRIEVALNSNQTYVDPDDGEVYPYNFYQEALLNLYQQNPELAKRSGDVYQRFIPTNLETPDNLVINGNYFTLDGSNLPFTNYAPGSIGLGSPNQTQAANLATATGYEIRSVQIGIFTYLAYERNSMSDATIYNSSPYGNVTFSNLTILGNTQTPSVNYGNNQSQIEEAIRVMGRNSGGYIGIQNFFNTQVTTENVVIGNTTLAVKSESATVAHLHKIHVYNSWANGLYAQNAKYVSIRDAYIESSGGPAIHFEDGKYSNEFAQTVVLDSSSVHVENWASGEESWFKAYTMELAAMQMKAGTNEAVTAGLNSRILRSIVDPTTGLMSRKMNLLLLVMPVGEQLSRTPEQIAAVPEGQRTAIGYTDMTIYILGDDQNIAYSQYPYAGPWPYESDKYAIPFGQGLFAATGAPALPLGDIKVTTITNGTSDLGPVVLESIIGIPLDFSSVGRGNLLGIMGLDSPLP